MLNRLYDILNTFYYYDMEDYETTPEEIKKTVKENPETIINSLLDIIDSML